MKYPAFLRTCLSYAPFTVNITGRKNTIVMKVFDFLFKENERDQQVSIGRQALHLDILQPSQRLLYYLPHNLIKKYYNSHLYFIMENIYKRQKGIFVDIGANLGIYSLLAKKLGASTISFEPEPIHFAFLKRNNHLFDCVSDYALSNSSGKTKFYVAKSQNSGASSLVVAPHEGEGSKVVAPHEGEGSEYERTIYDHTIIVDITTFDEFSKTSDFDLKSICLIKIDVEGNEYNVLLGMEKYLAREDSAVIWCEVRGPNSARCKNNYIKITEYMAGFGYSPFVVDGKKILPFDERRKPVPQVFDLLFLIPRNHCHYFDLV